MIDLISRKKVIEALTEKVNQLREMAEGIETWDNTLIGSRIAGIEHAIMYIQTEPPVDAAEIIMCKDCIRINTDDCPWNTKEYHMGTTDFCSWGEREDYLLNKERHRGCDNCKYNDVKWYEEPCDSCTVGGKNDHYERKVEK